MTTETEFVYRAAVPRIGGRDICWTLRGERGAVELWCMTDANLDPRRDDWDGYYLGGVEIHSPVQLYDFASEPVTDSCELLGGRPCWADGSSLAADRLLPDALAGVDMRGELLDWYRSHFGAEVAR